MFANTLVLAVGGVNKTLTRIKEPNANSSVYRLREASGAIQMTIRQTSYADKARGGVLVKRHTLEVLHSLNPVAPATTPEYRKALMVIENDDSTSDITLTRNISKAVADFVGTVANADQLLGDEY